MKHVVLFAIAALFSYSASAAKWILIFEYQGETKVHWVTEEPTPMPGLTIIGPIPDKNDPQSPPVITTGNTTSAAWVDDKPVGEQQEFEVSVDPQSVKPGTVTSNTSVYAFYVSSANQISLVKCGKNSDYEAILEWLKNNGGCTENRIGFIFRNKPLKLKGAEVPAKVATVTATEKYGDILIDGVPLVFD